MEKNQVLLALDEYNELRDIRENLTKGNIVGFFVSRCGDRDMYFYTENEVIKKFETQANDLRKRQEALLFQINDSKNQLTEFRDNLKLLRFENVRLNKENNELKTKPAFSIRNFIFGWKKK